jgi:uncharacterized protein (DUF362 family)
MKSGVTQQAIMTTQSTRKVGAVRCENHDDLAGACKRAFEMLPELLPRALPPQVVIKPNLCDITSWETGVTTDPRWLGVLAQLLRSIRPDVKISVVESDAISAYKTFRSCEETFERLGFVAAAQEAGINLVNLSQGDALEISLDGIPIAVRIPQLFLEEMYFISIANLKLHPYTRMTGILKNSLGLLTDADRSSLHPYLSVVLNRLHTLFPPDLCIIDGRIGLEGKGPILGRPVRMDTLLFGADALDADEAACRLMGIRPRDVAHLRQTAKDLGRSFGGFEVVGDLRPRAFVFDNPEGQSAIEVKFAYRRWVQWLELFGSRWTDRAFRLRYDPLSFKKTIWARLVGGRRAA